MSDSVTIKLSSPVTVLDETVSEVTLRQPRGKDLIEVGNPLKMGTSSGGDVVADINMPVMARMIARLANLTSTAVEDMSGGDLLRISLQVVGFLALTQD